MTDRDTTFRGRHARRADEATGPDSQVVLVKNLDQFGNPSGGGSGGGAAGSGAAAYQGSSLADAGDFRVVRAAATQLTLSELPFHLLFENLVAVYEYDGDNLVNAYQIQDTDYDWTWAPAADKTTGTLTLATAAFGAANTFVVVATGPQRDLLDVLTDFGGQGVHQSPRDFTVAFGTATTLALSAMEFDPDVDDIRAVVEVATGGKVRMTYTRREFAFTWAAGAAGAGTLTIATATMQATSTFIVFIEGPERVSHSALMSLAMMNGDNIYKSPIHFTAAYQAATAIDLSGHPSVTDVSQFLALKQVSSAGVVTLHFPHNVMRPWSWDAVNDRLTVTAATFANTDVFYLVLEGVDRHADNPGNHKLIAEVDPYELRGEDAGVALISAAQTFTAAWVDLGPEIAMHGYNALKLLLTFDINDSTDLQVRCLEKHESGGAEEFQTTIELVGTSDIKFEPGYWELAVDADALMSLVYKPKGSTPYVQVQIKAGVLGGGTAADMDAAAYVRGTFGGS